jgi:hypothetical protein
VKKRRRRRTNTDGDYTGVSRKGNRWQSTIYVQGKAQYLGVFDTAEEGAKVQEMFRLKYGIPATAPGTRRRRGGAGGGATWTPKMIGNNGINAATAAATSATATTTAVAATESKHHLPERMIDAEVNLRPRASWVLSHVLYPISGFSYP